MKPSIPREIQFNIEGMSCGGCALALEKKLKNTPSIHYARANATTHGLVVEFDEARLPQGEIEAIIRAAGYTAHPSNHSQSFPNSRNGVLIELAVAGFGMMNIMLFSIAVWTGMTSDMGNATVQFMNWVAAVLATPIILFAARPFYKSAFPAIAAGRMTMDVAIGIAIFATYFGSFIETMAGQVHVYYDAAIALTFFLLIGRQIDHMLHQKSSAAANTLRGLLKNKCQRIVNDGTSEWVGIDAIIPGDIVLVPKGERVPADGTLLSEQALFDESFLTGESDAIVKQFQDGVTAASLNLADPCRVRIDKVGERSSLETIARLIEKAALAKGQRQQLADRFAASYGPFVLISAAISFLLWFAVFDSGFQSAFAIAVAVLVVTCPCAAGLATPAVCARAANILLERGIIVKNGAALETLAVADYFVCDKTGTLSLLEKKNQVDSEFYHPSLSLAAASSHPVARAVSPFFRGVLATSIQEFPGRGLQDTEGNKLGSADFVGASNTVIEGPDLWFKQAGQEPTRIVLSETSRDGLNAFLNDLQADAVQCSVLSGDRPENVTEFAQKNNIQNAEGSVTPEEKLARIKELQAIDKTVAMLGDGINDAAALSQANVSISFSDAAETARNAADIVILDASLNAVCLVRRTAKSARKRMTENLTFAALYNLITVPIAIAGFLTPFWAAIFMSSSSVLVMLNAYRLRPEK